MSMKIILTAIALMMIFLGKKHVSIQSKFIFDQHFQPHLENNWKKVLDNCFIVWNRNKKDIIKIP